MVNHQSRDPSQAKKVNNLFFLIFRILQSSEILFKFELCYNMMHESKNRHIILQHTCMICIVDINEIKVRKSFEN